MLKSRKSFIENLSLIILALIIALVIWFYSVTNRDFTISVNAPIILENIGEDVVVTQKNPLLAVVKLEAKGRDFLKERNKRVFFKIDAVGIGIGKKKIKLTTSNLNSPPSISVKNIEPEYLELTIDELGRKLVMVEVLVKGKPEKGFSLAKIECNERVYLIGPKEEISLISKVNTESLSLANLRDSVTKRVKVIAPDIENMKVKPESVSVFVKIEKESARLFLGVKLKISAPKGIKVKVTPEEAQIAVAGPTGKIQNLKTSDIKATIKITNQSKGVQKLPAEIELPAGITLVKCEPQYFDVEIR